MTDYTETYTDTYKSLLNMCDLKTAADTIMLRVKEMDERMLGDVSFAIWCELQDRGMEEQ